LYSRRERVQVRCIEAEQSHQCQRQRILNPGKWEEFFFFDHPSGRVRVKTAMTWKAEHLNEVK
jgi:STE24 endopeptidase